MDCLFCKIVNGDIPNNTVYEDDRILAFHDIAPVAPVHVLVIPKIHIGGAAEITADTAPIVGHIFAKIPQIAASLGITDYRIVTNNGADAGQTVGHLHFHILGGRVLTEMG